MPALPLLLPATRISMTGVAGFLVLAALPAPAATSVEADFSASYRDPAGRAGLPPSPAIEPVWTRQNVWLPWKRWDPSLPSALPRFEPHIREVALIMATGARPDGPFSVPDLYRDSAGAPLPFDPDHAFFRTLDILKARGIRPSIDIGPVPDALSPGRKAHRDMFDWNVLGPADAEAHYRHIRSLFAYMLKDGRFSAAEMSRWDWQLLREPDNKDSWNPRKAKIHAHPGNLEEYQKLYDCTLAGMRDAGLDINLSPGNLMIPYAGVMGFSDAWTGPLYAWLASGANRCPEHLVLPRLRPGRDTLTIGFSAYGGPGTQIGADPRSLAVLADRFRYAAARRLPVPVRIAVAEGNLIGKTLLLRSDGTALGAAWLASVYKASLDEGVHRYQTWGFVSADHISKFMEHGGLPSAPSNTAALFDRMRGERRTQVMVKRGLLARMGSQLDAVGSRSEQAFHLLLFRFDPDRGATKSEEVEVRLAGLQPGKQYAITHLRVDRDHSSYLEAWQADLAARKLELPSPNDATMEHQFTPAHRAAWEERKAELLKKSRLTPMTGDGSARVRADSLGRIVRRTAMIPNSVSLLEIR